MLPDLSTLPDRELDALAATEVMGELDGDFTTSLDCARLLEDEIEKRGLRKTYLAQLTITVDADDETNWNEWAWAIRRATARQICEAAVMAAREQA